MFSINDNVRVVSGDFTGYYGLVKEIGTLPDHENQVRVAHNAVFAGLWIDVLDIELLTE